MPFTKGHKFGGRPKANHTLLAEQGRQYIIERVHKELGPIMDKAIAMAIEGDAATRKDLLDRAHGKPKEIVEHTGEVTLTIDV